MRGRGFQRGGRGNNDESYTYKRGGKRGIPMQNSGYVKRGYHQE